MSLKRKTFLGLKWTALQQVITQGATFIIGVLLMRFLSPKEFGLLAMVTVFSSFLNIFQDFGLTSSLIQKKNIKDGDQQVIFWVMLVISIILAGVLFLSSGFLADFYEEPEVSKIAKVLSATFIIGVFGSVNSAVLRRNMRFKEISLFRSLSVSISGIIAVYLAYKGFGVWSLVSQNIINISLFSVLISFKGDFKPKLMFKKDTLKEHLSFGIPLFGSRSLNYFSKNTDKLLIGKFLTKSDLGIYTRAFNLLYLPVHKVGLVFTGVLFSAFSKMKSDSSKISGIYLNITKLIIYGLAPFLILLQVYTRDIVVKLFGIEWVGIVLLVKVFIWLIFFHVLTLLRSNICLSQGHSRLEFHYSFFGAVLDLIAVGTGIAFGIEWVAINLVVSMFIKSVYSIHLMSKSLMVSFSKMLKGLLPAVIVLFLSYSVGYLASIGIESFISLFYFKVGILLTLLIMTLLITVKLLDKKVYYFALQNIRLLYSNKQK
ncbi:lipopolysaccharide biosynthesis protein [Salibacter halophilus]|uniref:lipopolysaccharide biosynthesis protein n=1 Tax=Salibacter halophilus TaxID=1803916 RepID=UPI00147959F0|nr:lipopolysaccharide biosynthesis protein [Salibacter halophilus]